MSKVFIEESTLTAIGNAIRAKEGSTALIAPGNMATKIANLPTGGGGEVIVDDLGLELITAENHGSTITALPSGITNIRPYAFYKMNQLAITSIPNSVSNISTYAFDQTNITLPGLPSNIEYIEKYALSTVKFTGSLVVPASLKAIQDYAFSVTTGDAREIIFLGTPSVGLGTNALKNSRFTSIKVPWSEGAVAGAPWGATGATVIYNYVHEEA